METIQFIQVTPAELQQAIIEGIKEIFKSQPVKNEEGEELLTKDETAAHFKVDTSTIDRWAKSGKLQPYGMGNKIYFKKAEVLSAPVKLKQ